VFVHQYDAGNDELWNEAIRFLEIPELRATPCSVWDIGAHRTASDSQRYMSMYPKCQFHAFEPNPYYFADLQKKFGGHARMSLHNYGLGARNSTLLMDSKISKVQPKAQIVSIEVALREAGDQVPTLLHINCEGT
jgi:FkbM family methyltransferase